MNQPLRFARANAEALETAADMIREVAVLRGDSHGSPRSLSLTVRGTFGANTLLERAKSGPVSAPSYGFDRILGLLAD